MFVVWWTVTLWLCTQAVHLIITVSIFSNFEFSLFKSSTVALLPSLLKHFYFSFIFFFSGSVSASFDLRIFLSRQVPILVSHFHSGAGGFEGSCDAFSLVSSTLLGFFW